MPHDKRRTRVGVIVAVVVALGVIASGVAVASHNFTDVPNDHTFHGDIEWMKDNRITLGCNPPANDRYCPEDNTTRAQMAAFMHRLATSRAVDAGMLGGVPASDYVRVGEEGNIDAKTLEGFSASDFLKKGDKAVDADKLDGFDSSAFLRKNGKAARAGHADTATNADNADLLNGMHSSEFLTSADILLGPVTIRQVSEGWLLAITNTTSVSCLAGEQVIGGGYNTGGLLSLNITDNAPSGNGWEVRGTATLLGSVTVYAICAEVG